VVWLLAISFHHHLAAMFWYLAILLATVVACFSRFTFVLVAVVRQRAYLRVGYQDHDHFGIILDALDADAWEGRPSRRY